MVSYAQRRSILDAGEQVWTVEPEALTCRRPDGAVARLPWREVTAVRTAYAPTRWKRWRYLLALSASGGRSLTIDNGHYRGVGDFEDRRASFTPFAHACIAAVAREAPKARASVGATPLVYGVQLLLALAMLALLALVLIALPTPLGPLIWIKLVLLAAAIPVFLLWTVKSRPRRRRLDVLSLSAGLPS
ncbi:hypothetical protein QO010_003598 [Caulobacter ginsengisoli]|uniref:Uncharacterized protein n=1 Tax=Caulobacter ginsengisoli TaxID=400775 RepID=A0ABU0IUW1_9CAUL|nr:hypothetical protein [Caulobacter ginsengisoli]MDQ0465806.1 hypothetical protein [Caulobacter ginsengisoli]